MKNWSIFLALLFFFSFFFIFDDNKKIVTKKEEVKEPKEDRSVFFSYIEFSKYIEDKSEDIQKKNISNILDNLKESKFNRIIVHVRPFSDSIYKSNYYPISKYILNDKGEEPNYDVLDYFIKEAHKRNITIDAWVNPYRVSNINDDNLLNDYSSKTEKGIYLNPAKKEVKELIVDGIKEIVKNYNVDGIIFDDYFYPDKKIDLDDYKEYKANGGKLSIDDFRRENVNDLIKEVYSSIKEINQDVLFGIAPEGNIDNCYNDSYIDVKYILANEGFIDYIMPQIYYGFYNQSRPFKRTIDEWNNLIKVDNIKLIPALALYKSGNIDKYALSGKEEWIKNSDILKREIIYARSLNKYSGFSLFSYNYMFNDEYLNDKNKNELSNIKIILK